MRLRTSYYNLLVTLPRARAAKCRRSHNVSEPVARSTEHSDVTVMHGAHSLTTHPRAPRWSAEVPGAARRAAVAALRALDVSDELDRVVVGELDARAQISLCEETEARRPVDEPLLHLEVWRARVIDEPRDVTLARRVDDLVLRDRTPRSREIAGRGRAR